MSKRKGFTFVEVTLFLAITTGLFLGIALGVNTSIRSQKYNDATQSFLEFMRSIYSKVSNPQSPGAGNSEDAIYGKLMVFGESVNLDGSSNSDKAIFVYDVVGKADTVSGGLGTGSVKDMLSKLNATVIRVTGKNASTGAITAAELASVEKYTPHWGASIDGTTNGSPFTGSILIVRHPRSGTINTLYSNTTIEVNSLFRSAKSTGNYNGVMNSLKNVLNSFNTTEINFCVNPFGPGVSSGTTKRQNIRLLKDARNASSVELIELDSQYNASSNPEGNKCW